MPLRLHARRRLGGFTLVELMIVMVIIGLLAYIIIPNFRRSRALSQFTACKANLKNMATAAELYSTDSQGRYPTSLAILTTNGKYLREIPTCPSASLDTYSATFHSSSKPDNFTILCAGTNHGAVDTGTGFPQYSSMSGLLDR